MAFLYVTEYASNSRRQQASNGLWAIEVKNSQRVHRPDLRHLKSFLSDYPECRPLTLHRGADRLRIDGIPCVPCEAFLRSLHPDRLPDETLG
jgi:hypothetical protein